MPESAPILALPSEPSTSVVVRPAQSVDMPLLDLPVISHRDADGHISAAGRQLDGATVLIIDDDVRNVFALTSALEMHGLNVLYSTTGWTACACWPSTPRWTSC